MPAPLKQRAATRRGRVILMSTPTCGGIKKNQVYYQTEHHGTMLTVLLAPMRKKDMATRREETTRKGFTDVLFLHKVN